MAVVCSALSVLRNKEKKSESTDNNLNMVVIEQRAPTDPFVGYGHWIQVGKPMSLLEAITFLNNAHADLCNVRADGFDIYVDPHNIDYRIKGVLH